MYMYYSNVLYVLYILYVLLCICTLFGLSWTVCWQLLLLYGSQILPSLLPKAKNGRDKMKFTHTQSFLIISIKT